MKEIEITKPLHLDPSQVVSLDTHSFLNILNVLNLELSELADECGIEHTLSSSIQRIHELAHDMSDPNVAYDRVAGLHQDISAINDQVQANITEAHRASAQTRETLDNLDSIFDVLRKRISDLQTRVGDAMSWRAFKIAEVSEDFRKVFGAIEKNSKGRYRIIDNIAAQEPRDYYVDFKIASSQDPLIEMPAVVIDVIRDLLANARKYTPPGGRINAGVWGDDKRLCIIVEDSGCGIPEDEIESVIDYGQRASNVQHRRTMGGGFGLTKAYFVCKELGGRFWIRSELDCGTRIRMMIPRQPGADCDCP